MLWGGIGLEEGMSERGVFYEYSVPFLPVLLSSSMLCFVMLSYYAYCIYSCSTDLYKHSRVIARCSNIIRNLCYLAC